MSPLASFPSVLGVILVSVPKFYDVHFILFGPVNSQIQEARSLRGRGKGGQLALSSLTLISLTPSIPPTLSSFSLSFPHFLNPSFTELLFPLFSVTVSTPSTLSSFSFSFPSLLILSTLNSFFLSLLFLHFLNPSLTPFSFTPSNSSFPGLLLPLSSFIP